MPLRGYAIKDFEGITREEIASLSESGLVLYLSKNLILKLCNTAHTGEEDWHSERGQGTDLHEVLMLELALDVYSFTESLLVRGGKLFLQGI